MSVNVSPHLEKLKGLNCSGVKFQSRKFDCPCNNIISQKKTRFSGERFQVFKLYKKNGKFLTVEQIFHQIRRIHIIFKP
jgi:hypothetical protein